MSGRATHLFERAVERMPAGVAGPLPPDLPQPGPVEPPANDRATPAESAGTADRAAYTVTMDALATAGLVLATMQRSRLAEEWRIAATNLLRRLRTAQPAATHPPNLLMVTSAKPAEGKSFSAINLAGRLAQDRMAEVLLIDLDTKRGGLTDLLGLAERPGAFDLAGDQARGGSGSLILPTAIPALSIMPVGCRPDDGPTGRSVTRPLIAAIEAEARRQPNRVVILDTAPCLATSDAAGLAPSVAEIAFIVEAGRTQRVDLEAALEMLRPCAEIVLVLNKMRVGAEHAFSGYHSYYG